MVNTERCTLSRHKVTVVLCQHKNVYVWSANDEDGSCLSCVNRRFLQIAMAQGSRIPIMQPKEGTIGQAVHHAFHDAM